MLLPTTWPIYISAPSSGLFWPQWRGTRRHEPFSLAPGKRKLWRYQKYPEVAKWVHQLHPLPRMNEVTSLLHGPTSEPNTTRSTYLRLRKPWIWPSLWLPGAPLPRGGERPQGYRWPPDQKVQTSLRIGERYLSEKFNLRHEWGHLSSAAFTTSFPVLTVSSRLSAFVSQVNWVCFS